MITHMKINPLLKLRKQCKKLLIDLELDARGNELLLAEKLGINRNQLNMALTGYRNTPRSEEILLILKEHLRNKAGVNT